MLSTQTQKQELQRHHHRQSQELVLSVEPHQQRCQRTPGTHDLPQNAIYTKSHNQPGFISLNMNIGCIYLNRLG